MKPEGCTWLCMIALRLVHKLYDATQCVVLHHLRIGAVAMQHNARIDLDSMYLRIPLHWALASGRQEIALIFAFRYY